MTPNIVLVRVAQRCPSAPKQIKPLLDATVRGLRGEKTMPDPRTRTLFATAICTGMRASELLALRWSEIDLSQGRITVLRSKTEAGTGREIEIWPELQDVLISYKRTAEHPNPSDCVFATATGKADTRSNMAKRLKRAVRRANERLAGGEISPIAADRSPHSLRRTFASLLYLRGENPVYVMQQMGHTDPKLALRIYTRVTAEQRRRGPAARLVAVLDGAQWTEEGGDLSRGSSDCLGCSGTMKMMAAKRQQSSRRGVARGRPAKGEGWRSRVIEPTVTDPKRRKEVIDRATSRIKTPAQIDTITLGRD